MCWIHHVSVIKTVFILKKLWPPLQHVSEQDSLHPEWHLQSGLTSLVKLPIAMDWAVFENGFWTKIKQRQFFFHCFNSFCFGLYFREVQCQFSCSTLGRNTSHEILFRLRAKLVCLVDFLFPGDNLPFFSFRDGIQPQVLELQILEKW